MRGSFLLLVFTTFLLTTAGMSQEATNVDEHTLLIRQTWSQEADGYDREIRVRIPESKTKKLPVIIFFHGNGGTAERSIREWARQFPKRMVVAPQGYKKSWNIHGEKSKAPDVKFFRQTLTKIGSTYPHADLSDVTLIGSSNGAGMIHRLMIEIDEPLFHTAIPLVASLVEQQFHDGSFWFPKNGDTDHYDTRKSPVNVPRILYAHGTSDNVVPFQGGLRFKRFRHLSAPETAWRWAQAQGYKGEQLTEPDGKPIAEGIVRYTYPETKVTFLEIRNGSHGLSPHRKVVLQQVREFTERPKRPADE